MKKYIGNRLISKVDIKDDKAYITFKKGDNLELNKKLYDLVVTTDIQEGDYMDIIYDKVARYILHYLADLDLPAIGLSQVITRIGGIYENVAKEVIGQKFGYEHESEILISDIIK